MLICRCVVCSLFSVGVSASAQELLISVNEVNPGNWEIQSELFDPSRPLLVTMSDVIFELEGQNISNFVYNSFAFDSEFFGAPVVATTSERIEFAGINTVGPLQNIAGPDTSNPLFIGSFDADSVDSLVLVGQNSGSYIPNTTSFPDIFLYQNAFGEPGTVPFRIEINPIPSSGSGTLLAILALGARRRRG